MPKIARIQPHRDETDPAVEKIAELARRTVDVGADSARALLESRPALANPTPKADTNDMRPSQELNRELKESGSKALDLIGAQTRQAIETTTMVTHATRWHEIFEAQRKFYADSVARSLEWTESYHAMLRATVNAMSFPRPR